MNKSEKLKYEKLSEILRYTTWTKVSKKKAIELLEHPWSGTDPRVIVSYGHIRNWFNLKYRRAKEMWYARRMYTWVIFRQQDGDSAPKLEFYFGYSAPQEGD